MFWKDHGILGINARNLLYIRPYNKRKAIKLADDKIKTKKFLAARDIPVPKLYAVIRKYEDLEKFDFNSLPPSFVVKPNKGLGGEGIIVVTGKKGSGWITASGQRISKNHLIEHIQDILDGRYSISNVSDFAFFEQIIISDDTIGRYSYKGLPDIRVVVHNLIPVMAMLRLPTKESDGKANLNIGGVGVGIDIAKGEATYICYKNNIIEEIPDGKGKIRGLKIPYWDDILLISSKVQLITNLGYLAVDICIDKNSGPVLLEINARAGLKVQLANLARLKKRLERIEGVKVNNPTKGIRIAKDMFGNIVEKEIKSLSGKEVIGTQENVELILKKGTLKLNAKIDTGCPRSKLDEETANQAGLLDSTQNYDDEKSTLKTKFNLKEKRIQTIVDLEDIKNKDYKMIIGQRDLQDFLVSPEMTPSTVKKEEKKIPDIEFKTPKTRINFKSIDQKLIKLDKKIKLLYHLRPLNLEEEKKKFLANPINNPQFEYPQLKFNPIELIDELDGIKTDNSPLGVLFEAKRQEILKKIKLLDSIDEDTFSEISIDLFGNPTPEEIETCLEYLQNCNFEMNDKNEAIYSAEDAKKRFEQTFEKYNLIDWKVKIKENMVTRCVAGKNNRLFVREDAKFTREDIESLIVHEIETHIITAENGKNQPYELFNRGLANYLITQEGLAMYNVEKQRRIPMKNKHVALSHVIAINAALSESFTEVYNKLRKIGIPPNNAFRSAIKAKRGLADTSKPGAFTKDYIYFKGYLQVKKFVENGGKLEDLYIGKYNIQDLKLILQIPNIVDPQFLPTWLKK